MAIVNYGGINIFVGKLVISFVILVNVFDNFFNVLGKIISKIGVKVVYCVLEIGVVGDDVKSSVGL